MIESAQIRRFSTKSSGRGWFFLSEAKSLKTNSKKTIRPEPAQIRTLRTQVKKVTSQVKDGGCQFSHMDWSRDKEIDSLRNT